MDIVNRGLIDNNLEGHPFSPFKTTFESLMVPL
jgi:hypothetical protein